MQIVYCDCCIASFPPDEGQLGDICPLCGWECDSLETTPDGGILDWSSANGNSLEVFRTAWFHSVSVETQRAFCIRMVVKKRSGVWAALDAGIPE